MSRGSGILSKRVREELMEQTAKGYEITLERFGAMKTERRRGLVDGYRDGMFAMLNHLKAMQVIIEIEEEDSGALPDIQR